MNTFDPETHQYHIDEVPVVSVTQVLGDLLPGWKASEWHLNRGRAVHAAAAMVAQGIAFTHDPQIDGQVAACRKFFQEVKPVVGDVERQVYNKPNQFAGTLDLACMIGRKLVILDYKATLSPTVAWQCAAYALAGTYLGAYGVGVELREDGTYYMSTMYDLKIYQREFLALLTAYKVRKRLGMTNETKEE